MRELQGIRSAQYCLQAVAGTYSAMEFTTPEYFALFPGTGRGRAARTVRTPGGYTARAAAMR